MDVYLQWSLADPGDWQKLTVATAQQWRSLPKKNEPKGGEQIDNTPGWVYAINVCGNIIDSFDHYSAGVSGGALQIMGWNDDPEDWPPGTRFAHVFTFRPGRVERRLAGSGWTLDYEGPDQSKTIFTEAPPPYPLIEFGGQLVEHRPWSQFSSPPRNMIAHGIWLPDSLSDLHRARQSLRSWEEWAPRGD